jgi:phosphoketolase
VNAETPGAIHEGGELGYCLAVAFGSIMDKPDAIAVAVIGDGESETGPTATAWHAHKVSPNNGSADGSTLTPKRAVLSFLSSMPTATR